MNAKKLQVPFGAPLNPEDNETQTKGCRHTNPDICGFNSMEGKCAFVRQDGICLSPSKAWKKQYSKLNGEADVR